MPQMAPINWLSLFIMFTMTFIMFNVLNYFSFNMNKINNTSSMKKSFSKFYNWKW